MEGLEQLEDDIKLAKSMSEISDLNDLVDLEARMIGYLQNLQDQADNYEFKSTQMRSKSKILKDYIRTIHSRRTELSISNSLQRKGL